MAKLTNEAVARAVKTFISQLLTTDGVDDWIHKSALHLSDLLAETEEKEHHPACNQAAIEQARLEGRREGVTAGIASTVKFLCSGYADKFVMTLEEYDTVTKQALATLPPTGEKEEV